jgi:excisionase family DNA binding protein
MSTNKSASIDLSDWVTQAEAARLRNVSRQAIARLVRNGRLRTLDIGGRAFVNRSDVLAFEPHRPGRPKGANQ